MKQLTITELRVALQKAEAAGLGDRLVITANDVEGNGYHGVWYPIQKGEELQIGKCGVYLSDSETMDPKKLACIG